MTTTALAILTLLWRMAPVATQATVANQAALPSPTSAEFANRIRQSVRLDNQMQADYTYVERRRDVKISKLGKVTVGPMRTFRVLPSPISGQTYKRLIAVDDKPLSAEELAKHDAEHAADIKEEQARQARETPSERAERLERSTKEQRERDAILEDAFRAYDALIERRDIVDGVPVLVARMTPRKDPPVTTREGRWMSHFEGHLWVAEASASPRTTARSKPQATSPSVGASSAASRRAPACCTCVAASTTPGCRSRRPTKPAAGP